MLFQTATKKIKISKPLLPLKLIPFLACGGIWSITGLLAWAITLVFPPAALSLAGIILLVTIGAITGVSIYRATRNITIGPSPERRADLYSDTIPYYPLPPTPPEANPEPTPEFQTFTYNSKSKFRQNTPKKRMPDKPYSPHYTPSAATAIQADQEDNHVFKLELKVSDSECDSDSDSDSKSKPTIPEKQAQQLNCHLKRHSIKFSDPTSHNWNACKQQPKRKSF